MRNDNVIGIDLAKNVFQIHIADGGGKKLGGKKLKRNQLLTYFANLSPSFIGMEACSGAHADLFPLLSDKYCLFINGLTPAGCKFLQTNVGAYPRVRPLLN